MSSFLKEIRKVGKELGIVPTIFRDEELKERGFGGQSNQNEFNLLLVIWLLIYSDFSLSFKPGVFILSLFSGIYGVGKAAAHPPALAVLSHTPEGATQTIAWVGKGIVYDTGGLSIKGKVHTLLNPLHGTWWDPQVLLVLRATTIGILLMHTHACMNVWMYCTFCNLKSLLL